MTFAQPFQDYEILDRVGAGAMGTVFKARQKKLNRIVALKVLKPSLARDSRYVDRLRREARIVASLNHPHIVTGYDLGEEGGYHFFVMEFVEGKSLRALLVEWGVFAEEYVLKVAKQVAQALDHAQQMSVIHRDIKPGNVLIDEHGNVKLTDMGLAKGPADMALTRDGAVVGTPQYISPEQARNPQDVDVRSDLYSLGATLYHMATGVPPFRGDTMAELITKVLHETPVPPNEQNPGVSEGLSLVLRKLLAKDLRVRYQTPRELLDDLERIEKSLPPAVDEQRLSLGEGRRRPNLLLRSAAGLGIVAVLGFAVWIGMQFAGGTTVVPAADPYFAKLDETLRGLTPGERLTRLRALLAAPPPGTELELTRLEKIAFRDLERAVDETAVWFRDAGWAGLVAWLRDPGVWPDRRRCENERILPRLRERCGLVREELPLTLNKARLDELLMAIDREIAARDAELLSKFDQFLRTLADRSVELQLGGDFAGAAQLWNHSLAEFCDGFRMPLESRLAETTQASAAQRRDRQGHLHRPALDVAEAKMADAMLGYVRTVVHDLRERLTNQQIDADVAGEKVAKMRGELLQTWPASAKFRGPADPWPEIGREIEGLQRTVDVAADEAKVRRFERRIDLAWRALCNGSAADALEVLRDLAPPAARLEATLAGHRAALQAAGAVTDALLAAMARANAPVAALPRTGSGFTVELRVESESGRPVLWCTAVGQAPRRASVTEFRFAKLLAQVRQAAGGDPLAALPRDVAALGKAVLTMVGDDLEGLEAQLAQLGTPFVLDHVWPRILAVRGEIAETVLDRAGMFARLGEALESARRDGTLHELLAAIRTCRTQVAADDLTDKERTQLRIASAYHKLAQRRVDVSDDVKRDAPEGATIDVAVAGDEITAEVAMSAPVLMRRAAAGWELHDGELEFAGGDHPWRELEGHRLECHTGLDGAQRTQIQLDLVLPPAGVGRRLWLVEFRGITVLFAVAATDAVHVALLDGDVRREEHAERAFQRAIRGVLDKPKAVVVPGGVHRLTIEVVPRRRTIRVALEGTVLLEEQRDIDAQKPATLVLHPRQEIVVQKLVARGFGM